MASDFFTSLGRNVAQALSSPDGRERLSSTLRSTLENHLAPPMARDQNFSNTMPPRGGTNYDQNPSDQPNGAMIDSVACQTLIERCIQGLDDEERDKLMTWLVDYTQRDANMDSGLQRRPGMPKYGRDQVPNNNQQVLDSRSGNRAARDNRRPAQDAAIRSLNARTFAARWGTQTAHIKLGGTGR